MTDRRQASMSAPATYSLSLEDHGVQGSYICSCLCFSNDDGYHSTQQVSAKLDAAVKRTATHLPILAGHVQHVPAAEGFPFLPTAPRRSSAGSTVHGEQRAKVEARVTLQAISALQPTIKVLTHEEFPHTYKSLTESRMPASILTDDNAQALMPPAIGLLGPGITTPPVFAAQANLLDGGVLVTLCLHPCAANVVTMATIVRHMSISGDILPARKVTLQMLQADAAGRSRTSHDQGDDFESSSQHARQNVSTAGPIRSSSIGSPGISRILFFSLPKLVATKEMINERYQWSGNESDSFITTFHCLITILWKAIVRARWPQHIFPGFDGQVSTLMISVKASNGIAEGSRDQYNNNTNTSSDTRAPIVRLALPLDVGTLAETAKVVRAYNVHSRTERQSRSEPIPIEDRLDTWPGAHPQTDVVQSVTINDWSEMPVEDEAGLSLGLGSPQYVRKLYQGATKDDCVVLPFKEEQGIWEVMVQMQEDGMARLLEDPGLTPFLIDVA